MLPFLLFTETRTVVYQGYLRGLQFYEPQPLLKSRLLRLDRVM